MDSLSGNEQKDAGGIVLCGGKSRRMGRPKLSLPFGPETMLGRVVRILKEVVSPVVVVAARGQMLTPLDDDVMIVRDEREDLGPLGGLLTGLSRLRPRIEAAFVTSCDVPLLKPEFIRRMIELLGTHELVIPCDEDYHYPLAAVYRTRLEDNVRSLIDRGYRRPLDLVRESDSMIVDVDQLRAVDSQLSSLHNTNTQDDYEAALRVAGFANGTLDVDD